MIILVGVAGAGKSLQGRMLADEHGYAWISTGEILRVLVTGKRRQEMLHGKLLSDDEMIRLMDKVFDLVDTSQEFVLDGFPRTVVQAEWLLTQSKRGRFKLRAVVNLRASQEVVKDRLLQRGRPDDHHSAIKERFQEYQAVTRPIVDKFQDAGVPIVSINAEQPPNQVHDDILGNIQKL